MSSQNPPPATGDHRRSASERDNDTLPHQRARRRRLFIGACLAGATLLTGCTTAGASDPLQTTAHLVVATPAASPKPSRTAAGSVLPAPAANLAAFDPATRTVVLASRTTLSLVDANAPQTPPRIVTLPAAPASLHTAPDGTVLAAIPTKNLVARVNLRTGTVETIPVSGGPVDAVDLGGPLAVALRDTHDVAIVDHGVVTRGTGNLQDPAQLITPGGSLLALDRLTTSVTQLDTHTAATGDALRAGDGATNAVTDRYGRALVVDTRGGALLAFSTGPLMLKQLYPVPGAPYAIAYDPTRDLAWVTLTATNEVVGYDVAGGEPVERYRLPTVRQPDALAVDPVSGQVFVASAAGEGLQVVKV